jgi:hypothetical protein
MEPRMTAIVQPQSTIASAVRPQAQNRPLLTPNPAPTPPPRSDDVQSARTASPSAVARDQVSRAATALDQALAAGREAAGVLVDGHDLLKAAAKNQSGGELAQQTARAIFQRYDQMIAEGGGLLSGGIVAAQIDAESAAVEIPGIDARRGGPIVRVALDGDVAALARDTQASLARLEAGVAQLSAYAPKLAAHGRFLDSLDSGLRAATAPDLNAETARLAALNVSQGLSANGGAISNAAPQTILALFRD